MRSHLVQFYESEKFMIEGLADYIGSALSSGDQGIVITTGEHLAQLEEKLNARGLLGNHPSRIDHPYIALEVDRMLPLFMANGLPDRARFHDAIGGVIMRAADAHPGHIYIFGEMVAILSKTPCPMGVCGRHDAAIQVEQYFNELQLQHAFSLLCAYPLSVFSRSEDSGSFDRVCDLHSEIMLAESFNPSVNLLALRRTVASLQQQAYALSTEVRDRKQVEQALREVNFDRLTGLPNRNVFQDRLEMDIKKANRTGLPVALLFIDLDHFKEINDTMGHSAGDKLLKQVGRRLVSYVRESDTVTRLGGDEFTITLSEMHDTDSITDVAQKILCDLTLPFQLDDEIAYISASIGITIYPQDASNASELLRNADQAMYQSKNLGRNCFSYFTPCMQEAAQARMTLSNDLRRALGSDQLEVFYQPIVDMASGRIVKAEALIRWHHPENGSVSPDDFIPVAEHTGLICPIGDWVFYEALHQARRWRTYDPHFTVSVNVSPAQLIRRSEDQHRDWLAHCESFSHANELATSAVGLEITEGLLLHTDKGVMNQLAALQNAGIKISLDDFGTGYSSLSYLRKFNLDYLKIDKSFVFNLEYDESNQALCEAIIVMAHKLGLQVIAEGVETASQNELLRQAGCDFAQGFLHGYPVPGRELEKRLKRAALECVAS